MKNSNIISIIMPVYKTNYKIFLRALQSIKCQSNHNWELIIVDDDEKNDKFYKILKEHEKIETDDRIKFIFHEKNMGANIARNNGVINSKGDILAFLDADDKWSEQYLKEMLQKFDSDRIGLVSCGYYVHNGKKRKRIYNFHKSGDIYEKELYGDILSPTSAVMVRKEALIKAGKFDIKLPARQDYDMWLRICKDYYVNFLNKPLVTVYRDGHNCISKKYRNVLYGTEAILNKIAQNVKLDKKLQDIKYSHYKKLLIVAIKNKDKKYIRKYYEKIKKLKGFIYTLPYVLWVYFPGAYGVIRELLKKLLYR